jgi:lysophospholipase L1-like esterase
MIGANDGFLCQATTADKCASELPGVLTKISANVKTILSQIRGAGGYRHQIVIVNYYSTDYTDPVQNAQSQALNQAMDSAAKPFHVAIADGYGTFQRAAAQAGGNTCAAGLLTTLTTGGCGVHPSVAGQELLAGAVERVISQR